MLGRAAGCEGQCQSWQGRPGSHGSVMGTLTRASRPCACWTTAPSVLSSAGWYMGTACRRCLHCLLLTWPSCSSPSDPSPLPGPNGTVSGGASHWGVGRGVRLCLPCSKGLGLTQCLGGGGSAPPACSSPTFWGLPPALRPALPGPALERSPWEWLLGRNRAEERKWESRAPSTRGSIPAPLRGWFQSTDTNRQIQTHTGRFRHTQKPTRPTGASLPLRLPPPTPRFPASPRRPSLAGRHPARDRGGRHTPPTQSTQGTVSGVPR